MELAAAVVIGAGEAVAFPGVLTDELVAISCVTVDELVTLP